MISAGRPGTGYVMLTVDAASITSATIATDDFMDAKLGDDT